MPLSTTEMLLTDIESSKGPFFVIIWISFIFYGIGLAQVYFYFTTYRDHYIVKAIVVLICVLEALQVAACIHFLYLNIVADSSQREELLTVIWSEATATGLEVIINGLVQVYYIFRIWRLSRSIPVAAYLSVVLIGRTGIGLFSTSFPLTPRHKNWLVVGAIKPFMRSVTATLVLGVLLDSSITFILMLLLRRAQSFACKRTTRTMMRKLIYYSLSAGGLTTLVSVSTLIVFKLSKSPILYGSLVMIMTKVYANSMLAMLNVRQGLREDTVPGDEYSIHFSAVRDQSSSAPSATGTTVPGVNDAVSAKDAKPDRR